MDFKYFAFLILSLLLVANGNYLRRAPEEGDELYTYDAHRFLKLNAAQQRQRNRDRRRKRNGQKRTYAQDLKERIRKHNQANNRGNDAIDPYEPGHGDKQFARKRENARKKDCNENGGWACGWKALDRDPYAHGGDDFDRIHWKHYPD